MKYLKRKYNTGFTLIELLIVITIIAVLSAVMFTNFIGVRQRARDAQRKSDLRQIQASLELYKADVGSYPLDSSNRLTAADCPNPGKLTSGSEIYMNKIPCNPKGLGGSYSPSNGNYAFSSTDGKTYFLIVCLENSNDTGPNTQTVTEVNCTGTGSNNMQSYLLTQP